jgi:hypothetical protein
MSYQKGQNLLEAEALLAFLPHPSFLMISYRLPEPILWPKST